MICVLLNLSVKVCGIGHYVFDSNVTVMGVNFGEKIVVSLSLSLDSYSGICVY